MKIGGRARTRQRQALDSKRREQRRRERAEEADGVVADDGDATTNDDDDEGGESRGKFQNGPKEEDVYWVMRPLSMESSTSRSRLASPGNRSPMHCATIDDNNDDGPSAIDKPM